MARCRIFGRRTSLHRRLNFCPEHFQDCGYFPFLGVLRLRGEMCIFEVVFPFSEHGQLLQPAVKLFNEDIAYWGHGPPASEWPPLDSTYRGGVLAFLNGVFHLSADLNPEAVGG